MVAACVDNNIWDSNKQKRLNSVGSLATMAKAESQTLKLSNWNSIIQMPLNTQSVTA